MIRAIGLGTCSAMARVGAIITPFLAQVLLKISPHLAISIYGLVALLAAVASICLPIETKGRQLKVIYFEISKIKKQFNFFIFFNVGSGCNE